MTILTDQRTYFEKNPALIAANKWLSDNYAAAEKDSSLTEKELALALYRFAPIDINKIWVENAIPTTDNSGNCLVCFGIRLRGYAVLDAVCKLVTFANCVNVFKIPVKKFNTYAELFSYIKKNKAFMLYKVAESPDGKYGLLDDTSLPQSIRYQSFLKALGDVYFDVAVSYEDKTTTLSYPVTGTIALSHGSMSTTTLELYHYQDILKT